MPNNKIGGLSDANHIVNKWGKVHSVPADWPLPEGARWATDAEAAAYEAAPVAEVAKVEPVEPEKGKKANVK